MPIGCGAAISTVTDKVEELKPESILDIGCGFGSYGVLFRQYLDIMQERYGKEEWQTIIDAVEIWPGYLTPVHSHVYDDIIIADIRDLAASNPTGRFYDLIFLGDVIEHMPKEEGVFLLDQLKLCCKYLVIVTPASFCNSVKSYRGNTSEEHLSLWKVEDFLTEGFEILKENPVVAWWRK